MHYVESYDAATAQNVPAPSIPPRLGERQEKQIGEENYSHEVAADLAQRRARERVFAV